MLQSVTSLPAVIDLRDQLNALLPKVARGHAKPKVMKLGVGV